MDPNNEVTQYREEQALDACIQAGDCANGGHPFGWVILAALVVLFLKGGSTVRLMILGIFAIPLIGLAVSLGVPSLVLYVLGDALPKGWPRAFVYFGAVAATIWLLYRWIDKRDPDGERHDEEKPK